MGIIMAPIPWPEKHIRTAHAAPGRRKPILVRKEVLLFLGAFFAVQMMAATSPAEETDPGRLSEKLSLELCASAAYLSGNDADEYPEVDGSGLETGREYENFHDGTVTADLPYTAADRITITPTLSYTFPLCRDARHEMKYFSMTGKDDTFVHGGVVFARRF